MLVVNCYLEPAQNLVSDQPCDWLLIAAIAENRGQGNNQELLIEQLRRTYFVALYLREMGSERGSSDAVTRNVTLGLHSQLLGSLEGKQVHATGVQRKR